jgi:acetyl/propionyl-CoA carboxylase alpha subunit
MVIKAVAGGGGRGLRVVHSTAELEEAYARCQSEARQAFGDDKVYVERFMPRARHIEVQVVGDGSAVSHLGERECSIQRRHQKLVEIAPCPSLPPALRARITADAVRMATALHYQNVGTFEFLVDAAAMGCLSPRSEPPTRDQGPETKDQHAYAFLEANPRLQVEHTVTEEVLGLDLVKIQLQLAAGKSLAELDPTALPYSCGSTPRPWAPMAVRGRQAERWWHSKCRQVPACGPTPAGTWAIGSTPTSTPSWPS